ncbi:MAG: hypothetical protein AAF609_23345 [Cyanobacteria bacterium P01_C01_bin.120]
MTHNPLEEERYGNDSRLEPIQSDIPASDITREKNIWQLLKSSSVLPKSKFNLIATASFFSITVLYVIFSHESVIVLKQNSLNWAERGFSFSTGILGFLVAGLAIFTAVNDVRIFTSMSRVRHRSGLSYLKYNFLSLMYVFILYLGLAFTCFTFQVFGEDGGIGSALIAFAESVFSGFDALIAKSVIIRCSIVILYTLFFYCLMLLKTFIFDIYHLMMTNIRWNAEEENHWEE